MILGGNAQKRPFGFAVWICRPSSVCLLRRPGHFEGYGSKGFGLVERAFQVCTLEIGSNRCGIYVGSVRKHTVEHTLRWKAAAERMCGSLRFAGVSTILRHVDRIGSGVRCLGCRHAWREDSRTNVTDNAGRS